MTTPSQINPPRNSQRQRGAAILIMVLILMLGLITLFTFRMDRRGPELEAERKTALALAQAKEALLGNSATNNIGGGIQNPGALPCPDADNDGGWGAGPPGLPPACPSNAGRLPWNFLDVGDLRDGAAERLWYVVDPAFIDNGVAINSAASLPALTVNGNQVVAVIIAPGPALAGQQRDAANQNNLNNYLESYGGPLIINNPVPPAPGFNDRMITITARELFSVVTFRLVRDLAGRNNPIYPPAFGFLNTSPTVWDNNNWTNAVVYAPNIAGSSFNLTFQNCDITYTVTGPAVIRSQPFC